jgi:hypothetical protein
VARGKAGCGLELTCTAAVADSLLDVQMLWVLLLLVLVNLVVALPLVDAIGRGRRRRPGG